MELVKPCLTKGLLKTFLALGLLFLFIFLLGLVLRDKLEFCGTWLSSNFGLPGMALGTFLADAIHFPVPPQFYMFSAIVSSRNAFHSLLAIGVGSIAGGVVAFTVAKHLSQIGPIRRALRNLPFDLPALVSRYGYFAVLLASASPIPFSTLCMIAGASRLPSPQMILLLTLRIPRLLLFYFVISTGWRIAG